MDNEKANNGNPIARFQELKDDFEFLDDWEQKFRHIIDLGKEMPDLPIAERIDANKIRGCASQVWLVAKFDESSNKFAFYGNSDSTLVQGLLAILIGIYSGATPKSIIALDAKMVFDELGLKEALTPSRANGLASIAAKIMEYAKSKL